MIQLELFALRSTNRLIPYWRERLAAWPREVWEFRHRPHTTGFSMAMQGGWFADLLHKDGSMTAREYSRWQRFDRRVYRLGIQHGCLPADALEKCGSSTAHF